MATGDGQDEKGMKGYLVIVMELKLFGKQLKLQVNWV
jgi:hypothetical protein